MQVFPGEPHDYEGEGGETVEGPLGEAEVVDQSVDVRGDDVHDSQKALQVI